jgi:hypothetical protein
LSIPVYRRIGVTVLLRGARRQNQRRQIRSELAGAP